MPVAAADVAARAAVARIETEAPRAEVAVRERDGRPVVAVRTGIAERRTDIVARSPEAVTGGW